MRRPVTDDGGVVEESAELEAEPLQRLGEEVLGLREVGPRRRVDRAAETDRRARVAPCIEILHRAAQTGVVGGSGRGNEEENEGETAHAGRPQKSQLRPPWKAMLLITSDEGRASRSLGTRRSEGALVASGRQAGGGLAVRLGGLDPGRLVVVAAVHLRDVSGVRKVPQLDAYRQLFAEEDAEPDAQRRNGAEPGVAERAPGDRVGRGPQLHPCLRRAEPAVEVHPEPQDLAVEDVELAVDGHQLEAGESGGAKQERLGRFRRDARLGEQLFRERALHRDREVPDAQLRGEVLAQVVGQFRREPGVHREFGIDLGIAEERRLPAARLGEGTLFQDVDANRIRVGLLRRRRSADQGCDEERSHDQNRNETPAPNVATFAR